MPEYFLLNAMMHPKQQPNKTNTTAQTSTTLCRSLCLWKGHHKKLCQKKCQTHYWKQLPIVSDPRPLETFKNLSLGNIQIRFLTENPVAGGWLPPRAPEAGVQDQPQCREALPVRKETEPWSGCGMCSLFAMH